MTTELPKQYDPKEAQQRWIAFWEEHGYFHSRPDPNRQPFTIVIPPPNVTGALHMGHALNNTLQDVLIRWRRMQGRNALWMPGTDHAGIATQAVVERRLKETENKTRRDVGREELVRRIWQWKDQYEQRILGQLRELGCSCDWDRTRFTLDEGCSRAVRVTFFKMFRDGYIFRGKRLVNWDTQLQTAVADDEIYHETVPGKFWTFRYPVKDSPGEHIRFSTTRPETMLGDTAVAVHPDDPRFKHLIGKLVTIPLNGRDIPVIGDGLLVDPTLGTGAVKVTPAHDPNDYACGLRQKLPMINILSPDGTINAAGTPYEGLTFEQAREKCVAAMEERGLLEAVEDREIDLAHSDRSKTPIQPYLSDQWFVKMGDRDDGKPGLAQTAMDAVTSGKVKVFPERYGKTYLDWLGEKRDWCISRQLWWGHRIPIWYVRCPEAELKRAFAGPGGRGRWRTRRGQRPLAGDMQAARGRVSRRDRAEVPARTRPRRARHLVQLGALAALDAGLARTNRRKPLTTIRRTRLSDPSRKDIITLWVARMVLTGLYNMGEVPFHQVYIHPIILDGFGGRMSKMKGNGIDPLDIIERYGTDALRFQMVHLATENQDSRMPVSNVCPNCDTLVPVKLEHMYMRTRKVTCPNCKKPFRPGGPWPAPDPELPTAKQASERFDTARNFANKLWNAARFLLLNLEGYTPAAVRVEELPLEDRWILSRLATTATAVTNDLEGYHFSEVARAIYDFTWSEFCDWYVEMSKGRLRDEAARPLANPSVLSGRQAFDGILRLVHPIMPFLAESIWQALAEAAFERGLPTPEPSAESVVIAPWPHYPETWRDAAMETRIARMQELVRVVREVRNRYTLDSRTPLERDQCRPCNETVAADFRTLTPFIASLAGVGKLDCGPDVSKPRQAATHVNPEFEARVSLEGLIDVPSEIKRLEKQLAEKLKHLQASQAKLENAGFIGRAPAEVVQQQRELVTDLQGQIKAVEDSLAELRQG